MFVTGDEEDWCCGIALRVPTPRSLLASIGHQAAIHDEIRTVHTAVVEQKLDRVGNFIHRDQTSDRRSRDMRVDVSYVQPLRAVTDDAGMDGVDPMRRHLSRERVDHRGDTAVEGSYHSRS